MKQKQQTAEAELEELKKKREERRKILEEEEKQKKQQLAEKKVKEEVEKESWANANLLICILIMLMYCAGKVCTFKYIDMQYASM